MNDCGKMRALFSPYLDGDVPGTTMQQIGKHLAGCKVCAAEFAALKQTQQVLASLRHRETPEDLGLKLRIAISRRRCTTATLALRATLSSSPIRPSGRD